MPRWPAHAPAQPGTLRIYGSIIGGGHTQGRGDPCVLVRRRPKCPPRSPRSRPESRASGRHRPGRRPRLAPQSSQLGEHGPWASGRSSRRNTRPGSRGIGQHHADAVAGLDPERSQQACTSRHAVVELSIAQDGSGSLSAGCPPQRAAPSLTIRSAWPWRPEFPWFTPHNQVPGAVALAISTGVVRGGRTS